MLNDQQWQFINGSMGRYVTFLNHNCSYHGEYETKKMELAENHDKTKSK